MKSFYLEDIQEAVANIDELIERAKLILDGAPYFTYVPQEQYVRLSLNGDLARLVWPESHSGYYDSCSIEEQSAEFPAELLHMARDQITAWTKEQKTIYDREQRAKQKAKAILDAERERQNELTMLERLKAKYEK